MQYCCYSDSTQRRPQAYHVILLAQSMPFREAIAQQSPARACLRAHVAPRAGPPAREGAAGAAEL